MKSWVNCSSSACETMSPVNGTSVNWPIASMTLDSHLTSPFRRVIYMSLLTQQGFFPLSLPYCFPQCAIQKCFEFWLGVLETSLSAVFSELMIDFKARSQLSFLERALNEAVLGLCCKEIPEAFMCPGDCPKHYTRGDLKFLMWCDRPSHWTLLKGVNLLWRHIVSVVSDNKLMTVYSPSGKSYWARSHTVRDLLQLPSVMGRLGRQWNLKQLLSVFFFLLPLSEEAPMFESCAGRWHTHVSHKWQ